MTTYTRFGTYNAVLPKSGPKTYPLVADFRTVGSFTADLTVQVQQGFIDFISGLFIDNSANANTLSILVATTQQKIIIPAKAQAYMPILASDAPVVELTTTVNNQLLVPFQVFNFPVQPAVWLTA